MHATFEALSGAPVPEFGYAVEVVESLIDPDAWQTLDLSALGVNNRAFTGVSARFSHYDDLVARSPEPVAPEPDEAGVEILSPPPVSIQRLQRIVRKPPVLQVAGLETVNPVLHRIMPAESGQAGTEYLYQQGVLQAGHGRHFRMDKAGLNLAIGMMLFAWVAVLGIGTYMGMTPRSGAKIMWRE